LEEMQPNHAISSTVTATKLLLGCVNLKKKNYNNKRKKMI